MPGPVGVLSPVVLVVPCGLVVVTARVVVVWLGLVVATRAVVVLVCGRVVVVTGLVAVVVTRALTVVVVRGRAPVVAVADGRVVVGVARCLVPVPPAVVVTGNRGRVPRVTPVVGDVVVAGRLTPVVVEVRLTPLLLTWRVVLVIVRRPRAAVVVADRTERVVVVSERERLVEVVLLPDPCPRVLGTVECGNRRWLEPPRSVGRWLVVGRLVVVTSRLFPVVDGPAVDGPVVDGPVVDGPVVGGIADVVVDRLALVKRRAPRPVVCGLATVVGATVVLIFGPSTVGAGRPDPARVRGARLEVPGLFVTGVPVLGEAGTVDRPVPRGEPA